MPASGPPATVPQMLLQAVRGFLMGAADLVPGVSGGTVALVTGIYEWLVGTIRDAFSGVAALLRGRSAAFRRRMRRIRWSLLLPLIGGITLALLALSRPLERVLETRPVEMSGVFFGLVAASIAVTWNGLGRRDAARLAVLAAVAAATFVGLGFRGAPLTDPAWWLIPLAGALAVCAMILPGISGAFLLLTVGLYDHMVGVLSARDAAAIALFLGGAAAGLGLFSQALHWLLRRYHETVLAALIGLMAGSLRVLWPWPDGTEGTALALPEAGAWVAPTLLAVGAAAIVLAVARSSARYR